MPPLGRGDIVALVLVCLVQLLPLRLALIVAHMQTLAVFAGVIVGVMSLNKSVNTAITSTKSK